MADDVVWDDEQRKMVFDYRRSEAALQAVAIHEAAHAVFSVIGRVKFRYVMIGFDDKVGATGHIELPSNHTIAVAWYEDSDGNFKTWCSRTRGTIERHVLVCLVAAVAEERFTMDHLVVGDQLLESGGGKDYEDAQHMISLIHDGEVATKYLEYMEARARVEVEVPSTWKKIEAVAEQLLLRKRLSNIEVHKICRSIDDL